METFVLKDLVTLCQEYAYNPLQALIELATTKYTEDDLSQPGRFTDLEKLRILNNDMYKHPFATRLEIHEILAEYLAPKKSAVLLGTAQSPSGFTYDWHKLNLTEKRQLAQIMEKAGWVHNAEPTPERNTPKRNGRVLHLAHTTGHPPERRSS